MKRLLVLGSVFVFVTSFAFAETKVLIDFGTLTDDGDGFNTATTIDFGDIAGDSYTDEEKAIMKASLFIGDWRAVLNRSSQTVGTDRMTMVKAVTSSQLGKTVMGVRVLYPNYPANADVVVQPPFPIPTTMPVKSEDGSTAEGSDTALAPTQFDGYGVINNVGSIKSISMTVRGLNYPQAASIVLADFYGKTFEIPMGDLKFDGWRVLTWTNPNYIYDIRNARLSLKPLYPMTVPVIRLVGIKFSRNSGVQQFTDDFITYVSDITVTYDKAVRDDLPVDIEDESVWGILKARELTRYRYQMRRFAERRLLEYNEKQVQDQSTPNSFPADGVIPLNTRSNPPQAQGEGGNANNNGGNTAQQDPVPVEEAQPAGM